MQNLVPKENELVLGEIQSFPDRQSAFGPGQFGFDGGWIVAGERRGQSGRVFGNLRVGEGGALGPVGKEIAESATGNQQYQQHRADRQRRWPAAGQPRARPPGERFARWAAIAAQRIERGWFLEERAVDRTALGPKRVGGTRRGARCAADIWFRSGKQSGPVAQILFFRFIQLDPDPGSVRSGDLGDLGAGEPVARFRFGFVPAGKQRDDIPRTELRFEDRGGWIEELVARGFRARKRKALVALLHDDQTGIGGGHDEALAVQRSGHQPAPEAFGPAIGQGRLAGSLDGFQRRAKCVGEGIVGCGEKGKRQLFERVIGSGNVVVRQRFRNSNGQQATPLRIDALVEGSPVGQIWRDRLGIGRSGRGNRLGRFFDVHRARSPVGRLGICDWRPL